MNRFKQLILSLLASPWTLQGNPVIEHQNLFSDYTFISVKEKETQKFPGNWSLNPEEIYLALKYTGYENVLKILEFGAGEGTKCLAELLTQKGISFDYRVFENDPCYRVPLDNVTYYPYNLTPNIHCNMWVQDVEEVKLEDLPTFDLVIVDGPNGVSRANWFAKFKPYTRPGTILLIDDFHHYKEFGEALDRHFRYQTILEYNQSHVWSIINQGLEPFLDKNVSKSFKIVIVEEALW